MVIPDNQLLKGGRVNNGKFFGLQVSSLDTPTITVAEKDTTAAAPP